LCSISDIETYAYVVFVVVSFIIVTKLVVPLALLRVMGTATIPCGEDTVDATLTAGRVLGVALDAAGSVTVNDEVIVEDIDIVDNPRLDIAVGKLLVAEGNKDEEEASADDTVVCELLMKLEACCDTMLEPAVEADIMLEAYDVAEFIEDDKELPVIVEDKGGDPGVEVATKELEEKPLRIEINRAACTFEFGLIAPIEDFS